MTLSNQNANIGRVVTLPNGTQIRVASDADAQLLDAWWQSSQRTQQGALTLGGAAAAAVAAAAIARSRWPRMAPGAVGLPRRS